MPNPAQIALAAARNLGMPTALPGQAAGAVGGLGGAAGFQANPQLLAQVMRTAQQQPGNPGQCKRRCLCHGGINVYHACETRACMLAGRSGCDCEYRLDRCKLMGHVCACAYDRVVVFRA